MAFNINEIRSQLALGGARPTLFQVNITNPANAAGDLKTPFLVRASQVPASTLGFIEVPYFGRKVKIAGDRAFAERPVFFGAESGWRSYRRSLLLMRYFSAGPHCDLRDSKAEKVD